MGLSCPGGKMKKILTAISGIALIGGILVAINPAQAAVLRVPKTTWPVCSADRPTYCVDSVSVTPVGGTAMKLTYVATGTKYPSAAPAAPAATDTTTAAASTDTATAAAPAAPTGPAATADPNVVAGKTELKGRWTSDKWTAGGLGALGYDGISIDAKTANEFSNFVMVNVVPTLTNTTNNVFMAAQKASPSYQAAMDSDLTIAITLKLGDFRNGVTLAAGTVVTTDATVDAGQGNTVTITGNPVPTSIAASSKDCTGEAGKAVADTKQFFVIIVPVNDDNSGFGIDGVSGDMNVTSNGFCLLSTPVWNEKDKVMTWQSAAPHFKADGTTINKGFYHAVIPAADAKLLWGLANANDAASALEVSVQSEDGNTTAATTNISVKNNNIIIDSTGFNYSKPKLSVKIKPGYKPSAAGTAPAPAVATATKAKAKTITCVKGAQKKTVSGANPKCPAGYKQK